MTITQIKSQIDAMSEEDRFFTAAYIQHLSDSQNDHYRQELTARMERMDKGQRVTEEQVDRLHAALVAEGI